jgi:hypothetical protein
MIGFVLAFPQAKVKCGVFILDLSRHISNISLELEQFYRTLQYKYIAVAAVLPVNNLQISQTKLP